MALNPYEQARAAVYDLDEYRKQRELAKSDSEKLKDKLKDAPSHYSDGQKVTINNQIAQAERYLDMSGKELQATYGLSPDQLDKTIKLINDHLPGLERQYPPLEQQPVGTPLHEMKAAVYSHVDQPPFPISQGLTEAQMLAFTRGRRGIEGGIGSFGRDEGHYTPTPEEEQKIMKEVGPRGGPLKETLDDVIGSDRTPPARPEIPFVNPDLVPSAPPPPTLGQRVKGVYEGVVDAVQRQMPYTPPPPTITPRLEHFQSEIGPLPPPEQPASSEGSHGSPARVLNEQSGLLPPMPAQQQAPASQSLQSDQQVAREIQAAHSSEFSRQFHQSYEKQPTPAPQQPDHLKEQGQPSTPAPQYQPGNLRARILGDQLEEIDRGIEQMKADMAREQGHPSAPPPTQAPQARQ